MNTKLSTSKRAVLGARRCEQRWRIRQELERRDFSTLQSFAVHVGVSTEIVSKTLLGVKHSPQVLDALRSLGIAENLLFDPRSTQQSANQ